MEILITVLGLWIACGAIGVMMGAWAGEGVAEFLLRLLLGPIGIVVALVTRKRCPYCTHRIHPQAAICLHCEKQL